MHHITIVMVQLSLDYAVMQLYRLQYNYNSYRLVNIGNRNKDNVFNRYFINIEPGNKDFTECILQKLNCEHIKYILG